MTEVHAEVEDQGIQQQTDDLDDIEEPETEDGLVFFPEVDVAVQDETAQDAQVEGDHIGPQVRHAAVEQGEDAELHSRAHHTEQSV